MKGESSYHYFYTISFIMKMLLSPCLVQADRALALLLEDTAGLGLAQDILNQGAISVK